MILEIDIAQLLSRQLPGMAMGHPFFKASEGGFIGRGWVSEDFTLSEFLFRKGMTMPIRLKVRPEVFPKGLPMSIWN